MDMKIVSAEFQHWHNLLSIQVDCKMVKITGGEIETLEKLCSIYVILGRSKVEVFSVRSCIYFFNHSAQRAGHNLIFRAKPDVSLKRVSQCVCASSQQAE